MTLVGTPTLFIDGEWCASGDGGRRPTYNPYDASVIMHVDEATSNDARRAIAAAKAFFSSSDWSRRSYQDRCELLRFFPYRWFQYARALPCSFEENRPYDLAIRIGLGKNGVTSPTS